MNQVELVGRLGARVDDRELPSGDVITTFSVTVDRARTVAVDRGSSVTVDVIACVANGRRMAARAHRLEPGTPVRVRGVLRRRFWRGASGLQSSTEVHVLELDVAG
ncbi:MAG: single-stranded DNA-binding protein [Actinobacteria bacterium]|nr:single-stranded DNA-binding protein [Actinomycetota bacterium]